MKYLVDTNLLLWAADGSDRLPRRAKTLFDDPRNEFLFSSVSIWEVAIKSSLKRHKGFHIDAREFRTGLIQSGCRELEVNGVHAIEVSELELHHGDPFDRMLVAQAVVERIQFITSDRKLADYPNTELLR